MDANLACVAVVGIISIAVVAVAAIHYGRQLWVSWNEFGKTGKGRIK